MKKVMFFAMATAALFASCSSDDSLEAGQALNGGQEFGERMPIMVNLGKAVTVETRGYGTIGRDTTDANAALSNLWYEGQAFNLYMFKKNNLELAEEAGTPIFNNTLFKISADQTGDKVAAWPVDLQQRYYPQNGAYDFWAYRLDDAVQSNFNATEDSITVDFEIDGSQDLMVAKADTIDGLASKYQFSAYSARRDIQPNLKFQHLLTRLHFVVAPGEDLTGKKIVVDSIIVLSKRTGRMVIAYANTDEMLQRYVAKDQNDKDSIINRITFNEQVAGQDSLILKDYVADFTAAAANKLIIKEALDSLEDATTSKRVGEALLVAPGETEYQLVVKYRQVVPTSVDVNDPQPQVKYFEDNKSVIKLTDNKAFEPGTSYQVTIKFYGAQPIQVSASLVDWKTGEPINVDPDENWSE